MKYYCYFLLFFSVIDLIYRLFKLWKTNQLKFFSPQSLDNSSILFIKSLNREIYTTLDLIRDCVYICYNFRKKKIYFLQKFILMGLLIKYFYWIFLVFIIIYFWSLVFNLLIIGYLFFKGGGELKIFKDLKLSPLSSWKEIIKGFLYLPFVWAVATIYFFLAFRIKKINKDVLYLFFFSYFCAMPYWLFCSFFLFSEIFLEIFQDNQLKRKSFWVWPVIIQKNLKKKIAVFLCHLYLTPHWLLEGNKLQIKNRTITLNPSCLENHLINSKANPLALKFYKFYVVKLKGLGHQTLINDEWMVSLTTDDVIKFDGKNYFTDPLLFNSKQRFVFSQITLNDLNHCEGYLEKVFLQNQWYNYNNYVGFILRANLYFYFWESHYFLIQNWFTNQLFYLNKKITMHEIEKAFLPFQRSISLQNLQQKLNVIDNCIVEKNLEEKKFMQEIFHLDNNQLIRYFKYSNDPFIKTWYFFFEINLNAQHKQVMRGESTWIRSQKELNENINFKNNFKDIL